MSNEALHKWCNEYFKGEVECTPLSGDASLRRYFRITLNDTSYIAADAPPASEKNPEFVRIAQQLHETDILAPEVLAYDFERGFLLLSDLGDQTLLPLLNDETVDGYYTQSLHLMADMQQLSTSDLPAYDRELLLQEMELLPDWFVTKLLNRNLSDAERSMLNDAFNVLIDSALEQPQVFVHRDYHSRNIMVTKAGELAVIDFQDAVVGGMTYDLVSILRDCYIEWPAHLVNNWVNDYYLFALQQGVLEDQVTLQQFQQWFDWMGLQRHIKVLGIFSRLSLRDKKDGYLNDLPLVLKYTLSVLAQYPEQPQLAALLAWFNDEIVPLALTQPWMEGRA
ncbi:MAG: phosphotransferase [Pseudomonadota bacterium]